MDKVIWKLTREWPYFLGNVLVGVRVVFLPSCPVVLSLLKYRGIRAFLNKKNEEPKQEKPLNSSIDKIIILVICSNSISLRSGPLKTETRNLHALHAHFMEHCPPSVWSCFHQQRLTCLYNISFSLLKIEIGIKHMAMFTNMS